MSECVQETAAEPVTLPPEDMLNITEAAQTTVVTKINLLLLLVALVRF